jgi:hypothetical protein
MRGIGKIDTTTLLLVAGGGLVVYMLTRPKVATYPVGYNPYGTSTGLTALQQQQMLSGNQNYLAQDLSSGGTALQGLSSLLGNFF